MILTRTIPVSVTPEAEAYIAELGMQDVFEQMLEHTLQTVRGLQAVEVQVDPPYDIGGDPCVIIRAIRDEDNQVDDPTEREWGEWKIRTFPPEVCIHFVLF